MLSLGQYSPKTPLLSRMCQYTAPEPASVQTLIFTHRYGINVFSFFCSYTTVHCVHRYACRHLLMFAMTLVWSKLCKYRSLQWKMPTYVCTNLCMSRLKLNHTKAKMAVWTQVLEQKKQRYIGVHI